LLSIYHDMIFDCVESLL